MWVSGTRAARCHRRHRHHNEPVPSHGKIVYTYYIHYTDRELPLFLNLYAHAATVYALASTYNTNVFHVTYTYSMTTEKTTGRSLIKRNWPYCNLPLASFRVRQLSWSIVILLLMIYAVSTFLRFHDPIFDHSWMNRYTKERYLVTLTMSDFRYIRIDNV